MEPEIFIIYNEKGYQINPKTDALISKNNVQLRMVFLI